MINYSEETGEYITLHKAKITKMVNDQLGDAYIKGFSIGLLIGLAAPLLITFIANLF